MHSHHSPLVQQPFLPGLSSGKAAACPGRAFPHPQFSGDCLTVLSGFTWAGRGRGTGQEGGLDQSWALWLRSCWPSRIRGLCPQLSIKIVFKNLSLKIERGFSNCSNRFTGGFVCLGVKRAKFVLLPHLLLLLSKYRIPDLGNSGCFSPALPHTRSAVVVLFVCLCCSQNKSGMQRYYRKQWAIPNLGFRISFSPRWGEWVRSWDPPFLSSCGILHSCLPQQWHPGQNPVSPAAQCHHRLQESDFHNP